MKEPLIMDAGLRFMEQIRGKYDAIMKIPPQNPKMVDDRREIHELDEPGADRSTQAFLIYDCPDPLGKHAHAEKTEIFVILEGEVKKLVTAIPAWQEGRPMSLPTLGCRREWEHLGPGTMIIMPDHVFHTFYFSPGTRLICYATKAFDPHDFIPAELV